MQLAKSNKLVNNLVVFILLLSADISKDFFLTPSLHIELCQYDVKGKYSNISKWLDRVYKESHPYFQEAHDILYRKAAMKS